MKIVRIIILMLIGVQVSQAQSGILEAVNGIILGNNTGAVDGTIRFTGTDIEGRIGGTWTSLSSGVASQWITNGPSIYYVGGNVGIGTGNPGSLLHVNADGSHSKTVNFTTGNISASEDLLFLKVGNTTPDDAQIIDANRGNTQVFTVEGNGATSIGASNPLEMLDVNGAIRIGNTSNLNDGTIRYTGSDFEGRVGGTWKQLSSIWNLNGGDAYYNGGDIGIGVSNPLDALHIDGDIRFENSQYLEWYESTVRKAYLRYTGTDLILNNSETSGSISIDATDDVIIKTGSGGSTRMTINQDGEVGIGTTGPTSKLHVLGDGSDVETVTMNALNMLSGSNVLKLYTGTSSHVSSQFLECSKGATNLFSLDTDGEMRLFDASGNRSIELRPIDHSIKIGRNTTNQSESGAIYFDEDLDLSTICGMGLQYDGNDNNLYMVGGCSGLDTLASFNRGGQWAIGTPTMATGYLVSVGGKMICEELQVELEGTWPDYVFKPEYNLMPLNELRSFVAKNEHLPNIPKAKVIEKEGIAVGEMQKRLMEKVEELTLYILQLKEEIDALKKDR